MNEVLNSTVVLGSELTHIMMKSRGRSFNNISKCPSVDMDNLHTSKIFLVPEGNGDIKPS